MGEANAIGMFDSGVGGLTVLKEVSAQLPSEDVIYVADTARLPYGSKTPSDIVKFNFEILNFLSSKNVKAVIMACGSSSSIAYPIVKDKYDFPIISLIDPGAKASVKATQKKKIGLIATEATVNSSAYQRAIKKLDSKTEVFAHACPLFVPLIEGGFIDAEETQKTAEQYLAPLLKAGIDTLILGCTHYPHLLKALRKITGVKIKFIDPAAEAVSEAKKILTAKNLLLKKESPQKDKYQFFVTGPVLQFKETGSRLFGSELQNVKQVILPKNTKERQGKKNV